MPPTSAPTRMPPPQEIVALHAIGLLPYEQLGAVRIDVVLVEAVDQTIQRRGGDGELEAVAVVRHPAMKAGARGVDLERVPATAIEERDELVAYDHVLGAAARKEGSGRDDGPRSGPAVPVPDLPPRPAPAAEEHAAGAAVRPEYDHRQRRAPGDVHRDAEAASPVPPDSHRRFRQRGRTRSPGRSTPRTSRRAICAGND